MNNDIIIGFDKQGQTVQYVPITSAVLRMFAERLVQMADNAVVQPNVRPAEQEPPDEA